MKSGYFKTAFLILLLASLLVSCGKKESFRTIAVQEVVGTVNAEGIEKNGQLLKGEHLASGDYIKVASASELTVCADSSKYIYAEPLTNFHVEVAEAKTSNIRIVMDAGSTLHDLREKLGTGDSYEVDTPNSTMAARGTRFRVTVYRDEAGDSFTLLEVSEGSVFVRLCTESGVFTGEEATLTAGEYAIIYGSADISEFILRGSKKELNSEKRMNWDFDMDDKSDYGVVVLFALLEEEGMVQEDFDPGFIYDPGIGYEEENDTSLSQFLTDPSSTEASVSIQDPSSVTASVSVSVSEDPAVSVSISESPVTSTSASASDSVVASASASVSAKTSNSSKASTSASASMSTKTSSSVATSTGTSSSQEKQEVEPEHVHTPGDWVVTIAPNCTNAGQRVRKCTGCGVTMVTETVAANGHSAGSWETVTEPTCDKEGTRVQNCSVCGYEMSREAIKAKGHTPGQWITTKAATCEQTGTRVRKCTVCSKEIENEEIAATGHSAGDWKVVTAADCTHDGEREKTCRVCGKVTNTETVKALGHDMKVVSETAATCTAQGQSVSKCSRCDETKTTAIAALGHDWGAWTVTKEANCSEPGEENRSCKRSGCTEKEMRAVAANPSKHVWSATRTKTIQEFYHGTARANSDEIKDYECTVCGATKGDTAVTRAVASEHNWGITPAGAGPYAVATCSHGNLYNNTKCTICDTANPDATYTIDDGNVNEYEHDQWSAGQWNAVNGRWERECSCHGPGSLQISENAENDPPTESDWHGL